jgi:hypothetical protein
MSAESTMPVPPDPTAGATPAEFAERLQALMRTHRRSVDSLVRRSRDLGTPISRATVYNLLGATGVPRRDSVVAFLLACGLSTREQIRWLTTFDQVNARPVPAAPPPEARRGADAAAPARRPASAPWGSAA